LIEREELETIIPHRGKMLLISRVKEYNLKERNIWVESNIAEDCIFYDPAAGGVPSWVAFEFMAQAISALSGIRDRTLGIKPRIGFILGIPVMQMAIPVFKPGSRVEILVEEKDRMDLIYTFDGMAFLEGKKAVEGKLMVMEVNEEVFNNLIMEHG
jgi:predicted hotdog family 3-hydroxylacyl-ACP dehydratase